MQLGQPQALTELVLKVCTVERAVELRRQFLCDRTDFQPYAAFVRLTRQSEGSISPSMIARFLKDNQIEISIGACQSLVTHYDLDRDGALSYKEFIEVLLPKEHPTLRAFVSQRECFDISPEEYLSYETEVCLAALLHLEASLFADLRVSYSALADRQSAVITAERTLNLVDSARTGNLNFGNLQSFFNSCGLLPYDAELINFLRRLDQDDDGVVNRKELIAFFVLCEQGREPNQPRSSSIRNSNREGRTPSQDAAHRSSSLRDPVIGQDEIHQIPKYLADNPSAGQRNSKNSNPEPRSGALAEETSAPKTQTGDIGASSSQRRVSKPAEASDEKRVIDLGHYRKTLESQIGRRTPLNVRSRTKDEPEAEVGGRTREEPSYATREGRASTPSRSRVTDRAPRVDRSSTPVRNEDRHYQTSREEMRRQSPVPNQRIFATGGYQSRNGDTSNRKEEAIRYTVPPRVSRDLTPTPGKPESSSLRTSQQPERYGNSVREERVRREYVPLSSEEVSNGSRDQASRTTSDIHNKNKYLNASSRAHNEDRFSRTEIIERVPDRGQEDSKSRTQPIATSVGPTGSNYHRETAVREAEEHTPGDSTNRRSAAAEGRSLHASNSVESRSSESLYKAFKMILNQERNLELARRELVTKTDFDVNEIFNRIDKKGRKWFTIEDFRLFLGELGLKNIDTRALIDLYSSYDGNQSCLLSFEQLVDMLCPLDNNYAECMNKRDRKVAGEATLELLADVFNRQFSLRKSLVDAKRLIKHENLDLNILFDLLDAEAKGHTAVKDILRFLSKYEVLDHDKDIELLAKGLLRTLDIDGDSKVTFKDFYMFFSL